MFMAILLKDQLIRWTLFEKLSLYPKVLYLVLCNLWFDFFVSFKKFVILRNFLEQLLGKWKNLNYHFNVPSVITFRSNFRVIARSVLNTTIPIPSPTKKSVFKRKKTLGRHFPGGPLLVQTPVNYLPLIIIIAFEL